VPANVHVQSGQPPGVPPLELTGERTLPDVPAENYWFRRHLAVYEWIGARVAGLRVIDMACGEGYGSEVLSRSAASVVGVDANPEAYEHARRRYVRQNLRFERALVDTYGEESCYDAVVFLQTIEHLEDPAAALAHFGAFAEVELLGVFHARKLRAHELALRLGWDRVHRRLGLTAPFYDRFTPALAASDFAVRPGRLDDALDFLAVCRLG